MTCYALCVVFVGLSLLGRSSSSPESLPFVSGLSGCGLMRTVVFRKAFVVFYICVHLCNDSSDAL